MNSAGPDKPLWSSRRPDGVPTSGAATLFRPARRRHFAIAVQGPGHLGLVNYPGSTTSSTEESIAASRSRGNTTLGVELLGAVL